MKKTSKRFGSFFFCYSYCVVCALLFQAKQIGSVFFKLSAKFMLIAMYYSSAAFMFFSRVEAEGAAETIRAIKKLEKTTKKNKKGRQTHSHPYQYSNVTE